MYSATCYSQFYCLSARGDSIISRDFRYDCPKSTSETFFRNVKFWDGKQQDAPPIFNIERINYFYLKRHGLYFVFTSKTNSAPGFTMELLDRLTKVFKDYCGILDEESIRTNFVLIYELIDEVMDHGYVQGTSSDLLKAYVHNEPIVLNRQKLGKKVKNLLNLDSKTTPSNSVDKSIIGKKSDQKNEIFVDIYERINCTFNLNGYNLNSSIDGSIQMKSYLKGNPGLRLALNEDLVIGQGQGSDSSGLCHIDACNFHETVNLDNFESERTLWFVPPDGEFVVLNYRITSDFRAPFRILPMFDLKSPYRVELNLTIRNEVPAQNYGGNVVVSVPMPIKTTNCSCSLQEKKGQTASYDEKQKKVTWTIKKFQGQSEQSLKLAISLSSAHTSSVRKEIGPISMNFEVPMYNPSGLEVRYLRVIADTEMNPYRWVRYITRSGSYVCRL